MTEEEIKQSSLLEFYALDLLSEHKREIVESYLIKFPNLKQDLFEIKYLMQQFSINQGLQPKKDIKSKIKNQIQDERSRMGSR